MSYFFKISTWKRIELMLIDQGTLQPWFEVKCRYIYTLLFWQALHCSVGSLFAFPCGCAIGNLALEHLIMPIISAFAGREPQKEAE